jgi:hypothetical protein
MTQGTSERRAGSATSGTTSRGTNGAHPDHGENRKAIEATLAELERLGRLRAVDEAQVQALRSIADSLDAKPSNSQMWKEYRETLGGLVERDDDSTEREAIIDKLRTPLRDAAAS